MVIYMLVFMFLNPDFWLPDAEFDQKYFAGIVAQVQKHEGRAAKVAFDLSRTDPSSPEAARLREDLDVHLERLARTRQGLDRLRAGHRLDLWGNAQADLLRYRVRN